MKLNPAMDVTYRVIGLMSGTSMDGIDAALIETDGRSIVSFGPAMTFPYEAALRRRLNEALGKITPDTTTDQLEGELTLLHARAVETLCRTHDLIAPDLIGFHGHTLSHKPAERQTWQIGDGAALARQTQIPVAFDFRSADVAARGEGAPLVPIYHRALAASSARPLAILNIGGVANVTWIGRGEQDLLAFDTGPGNAPLDDWAFRHTGEAIDRDGRLARRGVADAATIARFLADPYFARMPPKSLDRAHFGTIIADALSAADGAATLVECIAASIAAATRHFPEPAREWIVTGGGRHNPALMDALERRLGQPIRRTEDVGWDGDALEAQAFAYLAVRTLKGLPISFPGTTGVPHPLQGGRICYPDE